MDGDGMVGSRGGRPHLQPHSADGRPWLGWGTAAVRWRRAPGDGVDVDLAERAMVAGVDRRAAAAERPRAGVRRRAQPRRAIRRISPGPGLFGYVGVEWHGLEPDHATVILSGRGRGVEL